MPFLTSPGVAAAWARARAAAPPLVIALALAATYFATLLPGPGFDDTAELQTKAATWELPHETGYPSWLLLAQPFRWLPWHDLAWRMNVYSAVCAVLACVALYGVARELALTRWAALTGALAFGWSATFWSQAVIAEVYALNALCVALALWLALGLVRHETPARRWLLPVVTGIGAGNHLAFVVFLPLLAVWLVCATPRARRGRLVGPAVLHLLVHAACFVCLCTMVWRQRGGGIADVVAAAAHHAVGGQFHSILLGVPVGELPRRVLDWLRLAARELQLAGLALIGVGLLAVPRGPWLLLLAAVVVNATSVLRFQVPDIEVFLLPSWLALALVLARGLDRLQRLVPRWLGATLVPGPRAAVLGAAAGVVLAVAVLAPAWPARFDRNDRSADRAASTFAADALAAAPPHAVVIAEWRTATPLWYAQRIRGERPDVDVQVRGWRDLVALVEGAPAGRPLLVVAPTEELRARCRLRATGPLFEVVRD